MSSKLTTVIFRRAWGAYNAGERAGFEADKAAQLVREGFALLPGGPVERPPVSAAVKKAPAARVEPVEAEEDAGKDADDLEALAYPELLSRAKEVADANGEVLPSRKTADLVAYIRENEEGA